MAQVTYQEDQPIGFEGALASTGSNETDAGVVETSTVVKPGYLVLKGTGQKDVQAPTAAFTYQEIAGLSFVEINNEKTLRTNLLEYNQYDDLAILKKGYIYLKLSGTVTKDQNLFFVHTTGGASPIYTWRGDLDTDKASKTPILALSAGGDGDIIKAKINVDMQIGVS